MDQIAQIRQQKHKEYLRQTWLPEFFEKYKPFFDLEAKAQRTIIRAIKKHYLPEVANSEFLEYIPGIYRMRIKLTPDNLVLPKEPQEKHVASPLHDELPTLSPESSESESSEDYTVTKVKNKKKRNNNHNDVDIDQVIEESLKDYNNHFENSIQNVLHESIKDNHDVDYEEYILNQAIIESLSNTNTNTSVIIDDDSKPSNSNHQEDDTDNSDCYCLVIDIRDFHENPSQPLLINDVPYYLSNEQKMHLKKLWNKVNPDTSAGMKFQQDLAYQKGLINDKK